MGPKANTSGPLVSCIMPTYNRRRFIPQALRCFANRTYRNAELIVVDDSERSVRSLCEGPEGVRYLRVPVSTTGAKMNIGIEAARGDILQKIDDDDYYGPRFLESSVEHLLGKDPERALVTRCCFLTLVRSDGILRHSKHGWRAAGGFCFFRDLWRRIPFRDVAASQDTLFLDDLQPDVVLICDAEQYIVVRHGWNTWTSVRLKHSKKAVETDDYFRGLPAYEKTAAQLLDPGGQAFYRRVLRWRGA
jgi:glycosyltransferase involved in cell wall biosynthesis